MPVGVSAYVPLATKTLTGTQASVTFSSISQAYRDLVLVMNGLATSSVNLSIQFNGDTAANYNWVQMGGDGGSAYSTSQSSITSILAGGGATTPSSNLVQIFDYSTTDKHKTCFVMKDSPSANTTRFTARWAATAAITNFIVFPTANSFAIGSTFTLYGIKGA